ncbi:NAD(P)H-hydrate dehydratase [Vibrio maritimus]|uniref:NAD(P)H-hydrate dehydratase n=1 Tax=Vibrio maritimus TaxID=990268 RepID=UPI00406841B3
MNTNHHFTILPEALYTSLQVREGERAAAKACDIDMYTLMLRAGQSVFECLISQFENVSRILVCCGKGNNGGDGYVVGKLALEHNIDVELWQLGSSNALVGDAARARDDFLAAGGLILSPKNVVPEDTDVIVDALLGTGISGDVRDFYSHVIDRINQSTASVIAVDTPSGLNTDTGAIAGNAVLADATVTFIGTKQGLVTARARAYTGQLYFAGLGVDSIFAQQNAPSALLTNHLWLDLIKKRSRDAHKGTQGSVLVVGGNYGMGGAAYLASCSALRAGAGLVATLCQTESLHSIRSLLPEAMVSEADSQELARRSAWSKVLCIGPGLGRDVWGKNVFSYVFNQARSQEKQMVIDADGLYWLAAAEKVEAYSNYVLTPHPGEAARLLNCATTDIEADRFNAIKRLQAQYGGVVVLKGAGTLISDGKTVVVCHAGNEGMATGGMGDVLAGVIASMLAQGYPTFKAAVIGTLVHSLAADKNVTRYGKAGLMASDLLDEIRLFINGL